MKVGCDEEAEGGEDLHDNPGLDAIDGENAVGSSEPAKRRIVYKGNGTKQGETVNEPLFGHFRFRRGKFLRMTLLIKVCDVPVYR